MPIMTNFKKKISFSIPMILLIFLSAFVFLFTGCSSGGGGDGTGGGGGGASDGGSADINVSTSQVSFGGVVLDHFSDQTVSIQNSGSSDLNVGQIARTNLTAALEDPPDSPFSIINDNCSGITLAVSEECTLQIRFFPVIQGAFNDSFEISSNDADENSVTVSASGDGRALNVTINQVEVDVCPKVRLYITVTDKNDDPQIGLNTHRHLCL